MMGSVDVSTRMVCSVEGLAGSQVREILEKIPRGM